jgi:Tat protein translocase TatB subunit
MPTSLGPAEILVILIVALIVLGPNKLPEAGRQVGKAIAEVRKWKQGFQDEIKHAMDSEPSRPSYSPAPARLPAAYPGHAGRNRAAGGLQRPQPDDG